MQKMTKILKKLLSDKCDFSSDKVIASALQPYAGALPIPFSLTRQPHSQRSPPPTPTDRQ
jgi:hypothetical protein